MVPNRRLQEKLDAAEKLAKQQASGEDEPTVVGALGHSADGPLGARPPTVELHSGDLSILETSEKTEKTPLPPERTRVQGRRAARGSRGPVVDFEDDGQTGIDPLSDPDLEVVEDQLFDRGAPRVEHSVMARLFHGAKSVVTRLPAALRTVVAKTGKHNAHAPAQSAGLAVEVQPAGAAAPMVIDQRAWREMRTAPIFDGLPNEALRDALLTGDARVLRLERDSLVPLDGAVGLVRGGQVALALFTPDVLAVERKAQGARAQSGGRLDKKEKKRRAQQGPLIRLAEKNLATFEEGDVVETAMGAEGHNTLACYAVTPVSVITIVRGRVDLWKRIYPFMSDRFRRAAAAARTRLDATDGAKSMVADFFIRHGLSVSMTLRVRKLDTCIECKACEQACEERYGVKRLSINGRILGALDFVDACHTCTDARCIDPCNFDAISFDTERREILINEANCTGCTLCAVACPYDAIEMHELDETPKLSLRLLKEGMLRFGDGAGRKARLRRIASKCDHCAFYEDQACISACPTGALIEIKPSDVVSQLPDQARQAAKAGFDRTAIVDINQLNQSKAFTKGDLDHLPELGRARAKRAKMAVPFWWTLGLGAFALVLAEVFLRKFLPQFSLAYYMARTVDGLDPQLALGRVDFTPGCTLAVDCGYIGTALMISGLFYVWRRRLPFMRNWGSIQAWFDWHVMAGVVGPLFILVHTVLKLDNWISLAFWSMVLVVVSGLLGRYLTTQLPDRASTATVETLEVDRALSALRMQHNGVKAADHWFEAYRRRIDNIELRFGGKHKKPTFFGAVRAFFWVVSDDVLRGHRMRKLDRALKRSVRGRGTRKVRNEAARLAHRLALLERRRVLLPRLMPLFNQWKAVHIPMSVLLTVIATIHIVLALRAG